MKASELSGKPSWSRQSRRHRVIQAKLRSMTHLLGSGRNPDGKSLSHSTCSPSGTSSPRLGTVSALPRLHGPVQMLAQPLDEAAPVMTITPDQLHPGKRLFERREQDFRSRLIGPIGSEHFDSQQMALGVNQGVPFASPDFFSPYRSPFADREPHWF